MSSTHVDFPASRAIDGIYDKVNGCGFNIIHSAEGQSENWLRVDFAEWKHVGIIEVYNRINSINSLEVKQRLSNTELYVFGATPDENRQMCYIIEDGGHNHFKRICKEPLFGKGVELYQPPNGQVRKLNLCEVVVYGK